MTLVNRGRRGWVGKGKAESLDAKRCNVPHIPEVVTPARLIKRTLAGVDGYGETSGEDIVDGRNGKC